MIPIRNTLRVFAVIVMISMCVSHADAYPIKITENGIFMKCNIGIQSGYCKFDTGSAKNYIMPNVNAKGDVVGKTCFSAYGESSLCSDNIRLNKIRLNARSYRNVDFVRHPINLYSFTDYPVLAVVGLELFKNSILAFDLKKSDLKIDDKPPQQIICKRTPYLFRKNKIFVDGTFEGLPVSILLDTGASVSIVNERYYKRFKSSFIRLDDVESMDGEGKRKITMRVRNIPAPLSVFGLSKNIDYLVVDLEGLEITLGHPIDFILGPDYLRDEMFTIDFPNNDIILN